MGSSGMGSLFVGNSGLRTAQNAINTVANNIANVNTEGYVRQAVIQTDQAYNQVGTNPAGINQFVGLGVSVGEIVHARDIFVDQTYRNESGRQAYYDSYYTAIDEVQSLYQEIEGEAFQETMFGENSLWTAFQTLAEDPSDTVSQNLVLQKSSLFLARASAIYHGFSDYQMTINERITEDIEKINDYGKRIYELNSYIQRIEAGGNETAYDMRDERDSLLDKLSALANISYTEDRNGMVSVKLEGIQFLDEGSFYEIGGRVDKTTGYVHPYWKYLSNEQNDSYFDVFDFKNGVDTESNTDVGELKGLVQARGNHVVNFTALDRVDPGDYYQTTGMSVMEESEAQLDYLVHGIATKVNDTFCPNTRASFVVTQTMTDGSQIVTAYNNVKILDVENANTGSDGKLPPNEIFNRVGTERYTEIVADDGKTYYLFNEEDIIDATKVSVGNRSFYAWDPEKGNGTVQITKYSSPDENGNRIMTSREVEKPFEQWDSVTNKKYSREFVGGKWYYVYNQDYNIDTSKQYTLDSMEVSKTLQQTISLMPHLKSTGEVDYAMGARLSSIWNDADMKLYPGSSASFSFSNYYTSMIGYIATAGSTYQSTAETLYNSCEALDNQRTQTTGVSTDEELTYMIKYQNAYNAASRYIQTVSDMLEQLITSLA